MLVCALALSGAATATGPARDQYAFLALNDGVWQPWVKEATSSSPRLLALPGRDITRMSWFPDGRALLVNTSNGELLRVALDGEVARHWPEPVPRMLDAVLSSSGRWIAYSVPNRVAADDNDIWVAEVTGAGRRKVVEQEGLQFEPNWAWDERAIFFLASGENGYRDVWRVDLEQGGLEKRSVETKRRYELAVGPGELIAYSSDIDGDYEIYLQDGLTKPRRITQTPGLDGGPAWSRSSQELAFHSLRSGTLQLWRIGLDGVAPEPLSGRPDGARSPVWYSPGSHQ